MPIKKIISDSLITGELNGLVDKIELGLIQMLISVGNICLEEMEQNRGYKNVSWNLSDSRGFVVVKNKLVIYQSDFKNTLGGHEGKRLSKERALQTRGISIVVVAGMKYAEEVEAKGKNVYTSSELYAEVLVPKLLKQIFK